MRLGNALNRNGKGATAGNGTLSCKVRRERYAIVAAKACDILDLRGEPFRGAKARDLQESLRRFNAERDQPFKIKFRRKNLLRPLVSKGSASWQGAIVDCADEDVVSWFVESDAEVIARLVSLLHLLLGSANKPIILAHYNERSLEHFQKKIDVQRYWRPDLLGDHWARQRHKLDEIVDRMRNENPPSLIVPWDLAEYLYGDAMPQHEREELFRRNRVYMPPPVPGRESLIYQNEEWTRLLSQRQRRGGAHSNDPKLRSELARLRQHVLMATSDGTAVHLHRQSTNPLHRADFALIGGIAPEALQEAFPDHVVHLDCGRGDEVEQVFFIPKADLVSRALDPGAIPEESYENIVLEEPASDAATAPGQ